ncbi:MAG: glycine cleavage T C-terminal barrel domain-containing protein [Vicinamibacterales bacterium]
MTAPNGYSALHHSAGWIQRLDVGRVRLRGNDRRSYLHGLLTNDIEPLGPGQGVYAALLTAQGRMISDMHVYELGDAVLLTVPLPLTSAIRAHLDQFVFSEDVQVEDVTDATVQIGIYGPSAGDAVESLRSTETNLVVPSDDFGIAGFEVIVERESRDRVIASVDAAGARAVDMETLDVVRVESGVPQFLVDMTETTIPLEAGIEKRAISMTKGCYPGQEVIVRVLHRGGGRVARKLVGIVLAYETELPPAHAGVYSGEREIGTLTSVVASPRLGRPLALGYVHRDFIAAGTAVEVESPKGHRVPGEIRSLPATESGA